MKLFLSLCQKVFKESCKKITQSTVKPVPSASKIVTTNGPTKRNLKENIVYFVFGKYLLTTNTVTSGVLMVAGDLMAQEIEYRRGRNLKRYDWHRTGIMFVVGAIQGPMHHYFYMWIDRAIKAVNLVNVTKKILLDQFLMSPVFILAFFYPAGWLAGQSTKQCNDEVKEKFVKVYLTDWVVWPGAQFINFYYLHPRYRVIYVNFITMLYDIFLSYIKYEDEEEVVDRNKQSCADEKPHLK